MLLTDTGDACPSTSALQQLTPFAYANIQRLLGIVVISYVLPTSFMEWFHILSNMCECVASTWRWPGICLSSTTSVTSLRCGLLKSSAVPCRWNQRILGNITVYICNTNFWVTWLGCSQAHITRWFGHHGSSCFVARPYTAC